MSDDSEFPGGTAPHLARHGRVSYVAIPARDPITSGVFYEAVFGWTLSAPDEARVSWTLGPRDNEQVPFIDVPTGLVGAFVAGRGPSPDGILLQIYVEDIDEVLLEIESRGCEVIEPLHTERGIKMAQFRDPGRNVVGIWEVDGD